MVQKGGEIDHYYTIEATKETIDETRQLLRFNLPKLSRYQRVNILRAILEKSGADAMIECYWSKSSIVYKNQRKFYAILVFDHKTIAHNT